MSVNKKSNSKRVGGKSSRSPMNFSVNSCGPPKPGLTHAPPVVFIQVRYTRVFYEYINCMCVCVCVCLCYTPYTFIALGRALATVFIYLSADRQRAIFIVLARNDAVCGRTSACSSTKRQSLMDDIDAHGCAGDDGGSGRIRGVFN